jgi:hypothetical protein
MRTTHLVHLAAAGCLLEIDIHALSSTEWDASPESINSGWSVVRCRGGGVTAVRVLGTFVAGDVGPAENNAFRGVSQKDLGDDIGG